MKEKLSIFGLGKLGCSMMVSFAAKGWEITGCDILKYNVNAVNQGKSPVYEPRVEQMFAENRQRIRATMDVKDAVMNSDVSFIIVPTPSNEDGSFSIEYVENVIREIGNALKEKPSYHLVVVTSTVLPGDMMKIKELLEQVSSKKCDHNLGLCYNPDFIALGTIVRDFLNPDLVLIGESDKRAGDLLESIHCRLVESKPNIHRMSFHNAELSKIALNSYCTLKITFANKIAELCEQMPGGDAEVVTRAVGDDKRIGQKYFRGGLSYGGPCFPRDNRALANSAKRFGVSMPLAEVTDQINDELKNNRIPKKILSLLQNRSSKNVAVLGCTYKKDTTLVEESAVIAIIKTLCAYSINVFLYDPAGMENAQKELGNLKTLVFSDSMEQCIENKDLILIGCDWSEFKALSKEILEEKLPSGALLFDACNCLKDFDSQKIVRVKLGDNTSC